jgi:CRP-like cAMP-binding protein
MSRPAPPPGDRTRLSPSNRLLLALPASSLGRLRPQLEPVPLAAREVVYRVDEPMHSIYFVESGLCSLMTMTREGHGVESAPIGKEGLLGLTIGLGGPSMPVETIVQVPGTALRLNGDLFRRELHRDAALRDMVNRYAHTLLVQLLQSAACNRLHSLEERCCRWLLSALDRLERDTFPVTQELLAAALGVRRPSLTLALRTLQRSGLIACARGQITIRDRPRMQDASCECYAVVRRHTEKIVRRT